MSVIHRTHCRLCGSEDLIPALELIPTPPANEFVARNELQESFALDLHMCGGCGHVQLRTIVSPDRLFRNYVYVSGTSPVFVDHFRRYADETIAVRQLDSRSLVVEIGSNDGTLLRQFKNRGIRVLGIDPAIEIAWRATNDGIETIPEFFSLDLAKKIEEKYGKASLIIANNVYAHVDDMHGMTGAISNLLAPDGMFSFEVSYLVDVLQKTLFDTIYHEHLSYHSVGPLVSFFPKFGLKLVNVERIGTHGGSIRGYVCKSGAIAASFNPNLQSLLKLEQELGLYAPREYDSPKSTEIFNVFGSHIADVGNRLNARLWEFKSEGKRIAAFGAPAKATTLMYQFGLDSNLIDFIVDDSPLKQGLLTPGKHIEVLPSSAIYEKKPDVLVVLAWNFADSIMRKHDKFLSEGGTFIVPLPDIIERSLHR